MDLPPSDRCAAICSLERIMVNHVRAKAAVFIMRYHERHEAARIRSLSRVGQFQLGAKS